MKEFIDKATNAARRYNVVDFAVLKNCLVAVGVLFGLNYKKFFKRHINVVWGVAIVSYIWTLGRLIWNIKREYE
jgi:small multidrug resistance family-3 protein